MLPPRLAVAPRPLLALLGAVIVGAAAFSLTQPFQPTSVLIKLSILLYLAWGTVGGRTSALVVLALLLLSSVGICVYQLLNDPEPRSLESIVQGAWVALLSATVVYICFAPAARRHYATQRSHVAAAES